MIKSARFGTPASIVPSRLFSLPHAMQREGALMLLDMGLSFDHASKHLGMAAPDFCDLVRMSAAPLRRGGDLELVAEGL